MERTYQTHETYKNDVANSVQYLKENNLLELDLCFSNNERIRSGEHSNKRGPTRYFQRHKKKRFYELRRFEKIRLIMVIARDDLNRRLPYVRTIRQQQNVLKSRTSRAMGATGQ